MNFEHNILTVWNNAVPADIDAGMSWYSDAQDAARFLDPNNVFRAAGIIAALSPMVSWARNLEMAQIVYRTGTAFPNGKPLALGANCRKADAIFSGADPLDILGGDKVRSFYMTIADPSHAELVVIDRHAYDIAFGRTHADNERKIGKRLYRELSEAYRNVAQSVGVMPSQVQAVTWVSWRNNKRPIT